MGWALRIWNPQGPACYGNQSSLMSSSTCSSVVAQLVQMRSITWSASTCSMNPSLTDFVSSCARCVVTTMKIWLVCEMYSMS